MLNLKGPFSIFLLVAAHAAAQQPDPGVWFLSPSPTGASADGRFEVEAGATGAVLRWAPFGKTPVSWGLIALREDGSIELRSSGDPPLVCELTRSDERNYAGTCRGRSENKRLATMSRNLPPNGLDLPVSEIDFRILAKAREILSGPSVWNRSDERYCENSEKQNAWSLFCGLYQASFDVAGEYAHLRPVMEEVRAVLAETTNYRRFGHPLMDYNNLESTTYADITAIFDGARERLETRKACSESGDSMWSVSGQPASSAPESVAPPKGWGEGLSFTVQDKTYRLGEFLGLMADHAKVPNVWLTASTEVVQRTWKQDRFDGADVKGKLPNGDYWRYFSLCGEVWRYYDVPLEAAAVFDYVIDGAYSRGSAETGSTRESPER